MRRGEFLTIYGSGQGPVSAVVADGAVAGFEPVSTTRDQPVVTIGGRRVTPTWSGLAPGWISLWQIDLRIPEDVTVGENQELVVFFEPNLPSNALKLTIE